MMIILMIIVITTTVNTETGHYGAGIGLAIQLRDACMCAVGVEDSLDTSTPYKYIFEIHWSKHRN